MEQVSRDGHAPFVYHNSPPSLRITLCLLPHRLSPPPFFFLRCLQTQTAYLASRVSADLMLLRSQREHIILITQNSPAAVQPAGITEMLLKTWAIFFQSMSSVAQSIHSCLLDRSQLWDTGNIIVWRLPGWWSSIIQNVLFHYFFPTLIINGADLLASSFLFIFQHCPA